MSKPKRRRKVAWSYSCGTRKTKSRPSTKVRVYERPDVPGRFFMTVAWDATPSGRLREEPLRPGLSREEAKFYAEKVALARKEYLLTQTIHGPSEEPNKPPAGGPLPLHELFDEYHNWGIKSGRWSSARHRSDQERYRKLWLKLLEPDRDHPIDVRALTAAEVEIAAAQLATVRGWKPRTHEALLKYLGAATSWGTHKAGLLQTDPLRALTLPTYDTDTTSLIYDTRETSLLVTPHSEVDWRVTLACNLAYDTGRRIRAICRVWAGGKRFDRASHIRVRQGVGMEVYFEWSTQKNRKGAWLPISEESARLVAEALDRPEVKRTGWLLPGGRLGYKDRPHPARSSSMIKKLHEAERVLGIEAVSDRGYHGIKRRHVTTSMEVANGDTTLVGDITGNRCRELLDRIYRQQQPDRMAKQVRGVRRRLGASGQHRKAG